MNNDETEELQREVSHLKESQTFLRQLLGTLIVSAGGRIEITAFDSMMAGVNPTIVTHKEMPDKLILTVKKGK